MNQKEAAQFSYNILDQSVSDTNILLRAYMIGKSIDPKSLRSYEHAFSDEEQNKISFLVPRYVLGGQARSELQESKAFPAVNDYHPLLKILVWSCQGSGIPPLEKAGLDDRFTSEAKSAFIKLDDIVTEIRKDMGQTSIGDWIQAGIQPKYSQQIIPLTKWIIEVGQHYMDALTDIIKNNLRYRETFKIFTFKQGITNYFRKDDPCPYNNACVPTKEDSKDHLMGTYYAVGRCPITKYIREIADQAGPNGLKQLPFPFCGGAGVENTLTGEHTEDVMYLTDSGELLKVTSSWILENYKKGYSIECTHAVGQQGRMTSNGELLEPTKKLVDLIKKKDKYGGISNFLEWSDLETDQKTHLQNRAKVECSRRTI